MSFVKHTEEIGGKSGVNVNGYSCGCFFFIYGKFCYSILNLFILKLSVISRLENTSFSLSFQIWYKRKVGILDFRKDYRIQFFK